MEKPIWLKKAGFVTDFSKKCLELTKWFEHCNKAPIEQAFNKNQLNQMKNVLVELDYEADSLLKKLEGVV